MRILAFIGFDTLRTQPKVAEKRFRQFSLRMKSKEKSGNGFRRHKGKSVIN